MKTILTQQIMSEFEKIAAPRQRIFRILSKMTPKMESPMARAMREAEEVPAFMRKDQGKLLNKENIKKMEPNPETIIAQPKSKLIKKVIPTVKTFGKGALAATALSGLALGGGAMAAATSGSEYGG